MVIDASVLVAIFLGEPEREKFLRALDIAEAKLLPAPTLVEAQMVLSSHLGERSLQLLREFLETFQVEVVSFDSELALIASRAHSKYGKGRHPARLNFGDCMVYALAAKTGQAVLFKGNDFSQTDVIVA
jgi:ribonuclease VapC